MYRFALRPLWIVSHVFVALLVVMCVSLGFWQLRRHDERAERNAQVIARSEAPVAELDDLVASTDDLESTRYRPVTVTGEYALGSDLLVDNRSNDGLPGSWVVTPLRTADGTVVAVSRGFLGFEGGELTPPAPPSGTVTVTGTALPWRDSCGERTDDAGVVIGAACMDESAVEAVAGGPVAPLAIQQEVSSAGDQGLVPVPLPELDSGPHRGYAVQWFIFATIGLIGYPLVIRKVGNDKAHEAAAPTDEPVDSP
ncbi:SURF1 family protein [Actinospongicola halichondriae]|uniref:SURF1 family protein n=1 Tax=Actinospongicola halichondriae TaxID=3236844 RepID=UPI003D5ADCE6